VWKRVVISVGSALALLTPSACGSPTKAADRQTSATSTSTAPTSVPSSTTTAPAAPPACDGASVAAAVGAYDRYASVTSFDCSGAFAYALITLTGPPPYTGGKGTLLLSGAGGGWKVVNRATYCADGSVPAAIAQPACQGS
jgi:hypothetical protein